MNKKRLLSLVLTMCMMASLVPTVAFAATAKRVLQRKQSFIVETVQCMCLQIK